MCDILLFFFNLYEKYNFEASRGAWAQNLTVNATGCGLN